MSDALCGDVPTAFRVSSEQIAYLNTLVVFHISTLIVFMGLLMRRRRRTTPRMRR